MARTARSSPSVISTNFERTRTCLTEGKERRGLRVKHYEVGLAPHLQRADVVVKAECLSAAKRCEISASKAKEVRSRAMGDGSVPLMHAGELGIGEPDAMPEHGALTDCG